MVVGLGAAAMLVRDNLSVYTERMTQMRNYLREQLIRKFQLVSGEDGGSLKAGEVRSNLKVNIHVHVRLGSGFSLVNTCQYAGLLANGRQSDVAEYSQCKIWGLYGSTALAKMPRRDRGILYLLIITPRICLNFLEGLLIFQVFAGIVWCCLSLSRASVCCTLGIL